MPRAVAPFAPPPLHATAFSFTSLEETFHVRWTDMSTTPNKSMSCYTRYLLSGQVPTLGYGRPIGHVLNEINNSTWYNQPANIRYNRLATNINKQKMWQQVIAQKLQCNLCIIMLHNNLLSLSLLTGKIPLVPPQKKSFRSPSSFVCRPGFSTLCTCPTPTMHEIYHLIYADIGLIIQLYKYDHGFQFSMDHII